MTESLLAQTALGSMQGLSHDGVVQFRGIPYAEAPVGELRFAPPGPVTPWKGLRDAQQHGPVAPQPPSRLGDHVMGNFTRPQSEDCLTLTISTPAIDGRARPTLVWLHGGGYMTCAGSLDFYDGAQLAREGDLVVVGVNYRLGALGFMYQPEVSNGKLGVQDVIAALTWVQEHIRAFGGDPQQVCVMGQSAGGHTIMCLLATHNADGLFQKAILQSAPAGLPPVSKQAATEYSNQLLSLLDIEQGDPARIAAHLKAESPARILKAMGQLARSTARFGQIAPPFMPMFDELATQERFISAAAAGAGAAHIDLIIGTNREEGHAYFHTTPSANLDAALVAERFLQVTGREEAMEQYHRRRPGSNAAELLGDLVTDYDFLFPALNFAEAASKAGAATWVYQFDWAPPGSPLKACHCLELPFIFGNLATWGDAPMLRGTDPATFADLSTSIRSAWTSFAHTGHPADSTLWPRYDDSSRQTMRFAEVVGPVSDLAGVSWRDGFTSLHIQK